MTARLPITLISLIAAVACDVSSSLEYPENGNGSNPKAVSVAYLKSLCRSGIYDITEDMTISGTVMANDWLGEYYKSIVVLDDTGGIEIDINQSALYRTIPVYSRVTVFCNGMTLARVGGKTVLGAHPTGDFPVDGIDGGLISRYVRIDSESGDDRKPAIHRFSEISAADIGAFVCFMDIAADLDGSNGKWCDTVDGKYVTTTRYITDGDGRFGIRTLGTCRYADEAIPAGRFSVAGIIDYSGGEYYLRIVNHGILQ